MESGEEKWIQVKKTPARDPKEKGKKKDKPKGRLSRPEPAPHNQHSGHGSTSDNLASHSGNAVMNQENLVQARLVSTEKFKGPAISNRFSKHSGPPPPQKRRVQTSLDSFFGAPAPARQSAMKCDAISCLFQRLLSELPFCESLEDQRRGRMASKR